MCDFCLWLHVLNMMLFRFIHFIVYISMSFLFIATKCPIVYHIQFIPSSVDGLLASSHFLIVMNNPAMNIYVQVLV